MRTRHTLVLAATSLAMLSMSASAQQPPPAAPAGQAAPAPQGGRGGGPQTPPVVSPEVLADRRITFRILAPQAQNVRMSAGDIPGIAQNNVLTKGENGVWEVTVGPVVPGAYRYTFNIDGVNVLNPRSPITSESNANVWSMVYVPGSETMDTRDVPHGAVAMIPYYSTALKRDRRMHIYTPPGYQAGRDRYPVFYLLHGAGDSDAAWSTVGRAGFILDNLIAAKKVKPMIVVMPAGHTNPPAAGRGGAGAGGATAPNATDEFVSDFLTDVMPYVEKNYRVINERNSRAIAGLSMGGSQTLYAAIPNLNKFAYVGVFSSGILGGGRGAAAPPAAAGAAPAPPPPPFGATFEERYGAALDNAALRKGLKVFWFATGKDDGLITTTRSTVDLFKKHGFTPVFKESAGGHTWLNWRDYLIEFAPMLFQ